MHPNEVVARLVNEYPESISTEFALPKAHKGQGKIKA